MNMISTAFFEASVLAALDNSVPTLILMRDNQCELLHLDKEPSPNTVVTAIRENELVSFAYCSRAKLKNINLWVQDLPVDLTIERYAGETNQHFEYIWSPDANQPQPLFLNHFGRSGLTLQYTWDTGEIFEYYVAVEILATKLNAQRAEQMLNYLESKLEDVTRSCFSATFMQATATQTQERTAQVVLQEIKRQLTYLNTCLPRFRTGKRTRLVPRQTLLKTASAKYLSENAVDWVLSHLDHLVSTEIPSPSSIKLNNRDYELSDVESIVLHEDTNVYENQVIAGYIDDLLTRLLDIDLYAQNCLANLDVEDIKMPIPVGFQSMTNIRKKFGGRYFGKMRSECKELLMLASRIQLFFKTILPVKQIMRGTPTMVPGFLAHSHYWEVFQRIVAWYNFGRLSTGGSTYIYGLRTLDKLYEFFCLFCIIEALQQSRLILFASEFGSQLTSSSVGWSSEPANKYQFKGISDETIELFYEKEIFRPRSESRPLVYIGAAQSKGIPDFIIKLKTSHGTKFIILDAKYTQPRMAKERYLPNLTMKYIHGIGSQLGGYSPVGALYILHPRHQSIVGDSWQSFHHDDYSIFSIAPALPVLGTVEVTPFEINHDTTANNSSKLAQILKRTLHVLQLPI